MALTKVRGSILSDEIYRRENNLNDVLDKAIARNNISVYSKTESDGRYLDEASNLSDLPSITTARNNLDIYSKGEVNSKIDNIPPPVQAIWVGEIRRFSFPTPPPGFFSLDGSLITNGAIDYKSLVDSGCLFITVEGNNIRLFDQQHFGRGKGSSNRAVGAWEDFLITPYDNVTIHSNTQGTFVGGPLDGESSANTVNTSSYTRYKVVQNYRSEFETRPPSYTELVCLYHGVI